MDSAIELPAPYKDRSAGLKIFGVLTALLGACSILMVGLMLLSLFVPAKTPNQVQTVVLSGAVYGVGGLLLIWLGVGSFQGRRWARALLVIGAWSALITGCVSVVSYAFLLPMMLKMMQTAGPQGKAALPPSFFLVVTLVPLFLIFILLIALPIIWGIFYSRRDTRLTCEALDPVTRWTDRCPLPVLAWSLWTAFSSLGILSALFHNCVLPFFGVLLHGPVGALGILVTAGLYLAAAGWMYRLQSAGWWLSLFLIVAYVLSNYLTFSRVAISEMYLLMGYSMDEIMRMQAFSTWTSHLILFGGFAAAAIAVGYLIFLRRYFPKVEKVGGIY